MTLESLQKLARQGEGFQVEFKHKAADPQKIMREVVAFANAKGGWLFIGVDDDGTVRGLKDADEDEFAMMQAFEQWCNPLPKFQLWRVPINKKRTVLAFEIMESAEKPMFLIYNPKRKIGRAYFRVADKSVQASRELRRILRLQTLGHNQAFVYGQHEQRLMAYLRENPAVSLQGFMELANISEAQASEILITLTVSNVLAIQPSDQADLYVLKPTATR